MTNWVIVAEASKFAVGRAVAVLWGALVAVGLYLALLTFGPPVENAITPVIVEHHLVSKDLTTPGEVTFVAGFYKARDCEYLGTAWFTVGEEGVPIRVQAQQSEAAAGPRTGPVGKRVGSPQTLRLPEGATKFFGYMSHDCGWPWITKAVVGPYSLIDPALDAN